MLNPRSVICAILTAAALQIVYHSGSSFARQYAVRLGDGSTSVETLRGPLILTKRRDQPCDGNVCFYDLSYKDVYLLTTKFIDTVSVFLDENRPGTTVLRGTDAYFAGTVTIVIGDHKRPFYCADEEHEGELLIRKGFSVEGRRSAQTINGVGCVSTSTNVQTR